MQNTALDKVLDRLGSERGHNLVKNIFHLLESSPAGLRLLERMFLGGPKFSDPRLCVHLGGTCWGSPVLLGAGWDKEGIAIKAMHCLGFAGSEIGSVPEFPQPGNKKPRQFVIAPGVIINSLGFNSRGMVVVAQNLRRHNGIPIGISVCKNKDVPNEEAPQAHARVANFLHDFAKYLVINVSSPNTQGLRQLQGKAALRENVQAVMAVIRSKPRWVPLWIKIAPDLTVGELDDIIDVAFSERVFGLIACNTTNNAAIKGKYGRQWENQPGGLSGDDLAYRQMTTNIIRHIKKTAGRLRIMGVGGVKDAQTALEKILAGADMVQVVSGVRREGPGVADKINQGLAVFMTNNNVKSIADLVGADV